jgi:modified peptide precursor CbpA
MSSGIVMKQTNPEQTNTDQTRAGESCAQQTCAEKPAALRPDVIAIRKTCDAEGTGLSHFVLMDKQVRA